MRIPAWIEIVSKALQRHGEGLVSTLGPLQLRSVSSLSIEHGMLYAPGLQGSSTPASTVAPCCSDAVAARRPLHSDGGSRWEGTTDRQRRLE